MSQPSARAEAQSPAKQEQKPRELGFLKGQIWIADDFDDVDEEIAALFYAEDDEH